MATAPPMRSAAPATVEGSTSVSRVSSRMRKIRIRRKSRYIDKAQGGMEEKLDKEKGYDRAKDRQS